MIINTTPEIFKSFGQLRDISQKKICFYKSLTQNLHILKDGLLIKIPNH